MISIMKWQTAEKKYWYFFEDKSEVINLQVGILIKRGRRIKFGFILPASYMFLLNQTHSLYQFTW